MRNLLKKADGKIKALTAIIMMIILAIFAVSISPLQSNGVTKDVDYVEFNTNFESATQGQEKFNVMSNTNVAITYNIKLSGIPTGYQDLQLRVFDDDSSTPRAKLVGYGSAFYLNKAGGDTLKFDASVSSCTIKSTVYVQYARTIDFSEYDKDIKILLTGTYLNPFTKETESISKEQILKAHVTPADEVTQFVTLTKMEQEKAKQAMIYEEETEVARQLGSKEWKLCEVVNPYTIEIKTTNANYIQYDLKLKRTGIRSPYINNSTSAENFSIENVETLINDGFNVEIIERNSDGTAVIRISKGTKDAQFNINNLFSLNKKYTIDVKYKINEPISRTEGPHTASIITNVEGFSQGYKTNKNKSGIFADEMETYTYTNNFVQGIYMKKYYNALFGADSSIGSWTEDGITFFENAQRTGKLELTYQSLINFYDYRAEDDKRNIIIDTLYTSITYEDAEGQLVTKDITDLMKITNISLHGNSTIFACLDKVTFYKRTGEEENEYIGELNNEKSEITDIENKDITQMYAVLDNIEGSEKAIWYCTCTISVDELKAIVGEDLTKIKEINRYEYGSFDYSVAQQQVVQTNILVNGEKVDSLSSTKMVYKAITTKHVKNDKLTLNGKDGNLIQFSLSKNNENLVDGEYTCEHSTDFYNGIEELKKFNGTNYYGAFRFIGQNYYIPKSKTILIMNTNNGYVEKITPPEGSDIKVQYLTSEQRNALFAGNKITVTVGNVLDGTQEKFEITQTERATSLGDEYLVGTYQFKYLDETNPDAHECVNMKDGFKIVGYDANNNKTTVLENMVKVEYIPYGHIYNLVDSRNLSTESQKTNNTMLSKVLEVYDTTNNYSIYDVKEGYDVVTEEDVTEKVQYLVNEMNVNEDDITYETITTTIEPQEYGNDISAFPRSLVQFKYEENDKVSYLGMDIGDLNISADKTGNQTKILTLKMNKNSNVIVQSDSKEVENVNPVIYVKMPKDFDYIVKSVEMDRNAYIAIDNKLNENGETENGWYTTTIDGEFYIVIKCKGTYNNTLLNELNINITYKRKLNTQNPSANQSITAYMITDNANYVTNMPNTDGLAGSDGTVPSTIYGRSARFTVTKNMYTQLVSNIIDNDGKVRVPFIENQNGKLIYQIVAKGNPSVCEKNIAIPYQAELSNRLAKINNISIVARLPKQGNESIEISGKEDTYKLLADDNLTDGKDGYVLPNEFFENRNKVGDDFVQGDVISEISLVDLNNIKVLYKNSRGTTVLDSSLYTLEYSNSAIAGLNTESGTNPDTQFATITESTDLTNAKTIRVKMNSDYVLNVGESIRLEYEMTMPDAEGMVGAIAVSRYTEVATGTVTETDSTPVYVIKGENEGTVEITKKYEGYDIGVSPENASIQNIGFKLINLETNAVLINEYTDANGIIYTNAEGKALFQGVTPGDYRVIETTTGIPGYMGIEETTITVESQQEIKIVGENQKLIGNLEISKSWEDTDEQVGSVAFLVERVPENANDKLSYSVYVQTNGETGVARLVGLPYGTYRIKEIGTQNGWILNTNSDNDYIEKVIDNSEETLTVENKMGRGNIVITKTIPDADAENNLIEGLTFEITGYGYVNYTNKSGENVTTNYKKIVTINEATPVVDPTAGTLSAEEGITVSISADKKTATITINDVPLGTYIVEETEMPTIGEGENETARYKELRASFNVDEDGQTKETNLSNLWKYGYLTIEKTAGLLTENGQDVEIGDLSGFSVRITGTSLYGTVVDKVVPLNVEGKATIALEVGDYKIEETAIDGYTTYYISEENGQEVRGVNAPTVSVVYNKKTTQKLYNQHTGEGYVKVIKTLEGVEDAQKVKLAGIQFKITGKNIAGGDVEEIINIDTIEEIDGVNYAVGKSGKISTGGEYQIEEVESTVPDYFEGIEPMAVELSTANTEQAPLELKIENKRCKGNLEMKTETLPAGGDLVGIVYEVTEVEFDENGDYTKIDGTTKEVEGSNNVSDTSYAKLTDIPAGNYIVSLKVIPEGYEKDAPQIIEVPSYSTGYAYFEIIKIDEQENSSVKIEKQVLNENGEVATAQEFESAELNEKESFEVKITNIETEKVYYTFVENGAVSEIRNLPEGTYTIEEVYKPKYTTRGYYILTEENSAEVETPITASQDKYTFTIGTAAQGNNQVSIRIKNTINTSFGFGGQEGLDNFSRYDTETIEETVVTKSIVYIVDENNVAIPGAEFKLYDANNNQVVLGTVGNTFVSNNRKLEIKGLPVGKYTLKCVAVPEGYLIPKDKELMVYSDAVRVVRVEIKVNNPRGDIKLSTVYTENAGTVDEKEKFVSRSKYKVVDIETGELVKFVKTLDGNYEKTNLPTGLDTISVKSGYVTLEGIEVGNYQIGLVDVTDGFAITTAVPADITVVENEEIEIKTVVKKMEIVQISAGYHRNMYLDINGDLWLMGDSGYGLLGNSSNSTVNMQENYRPQQIVFPNGVRIKKFAQSDNSTAAAAAIDINGKIWTWGNNDYNYQLGNIEIEEYATSVVTCISDQIGNNLNERLKSEPDLKFVEISSNYYFGFIALDNKGRVWIWGDGIQNPICVSDIEGTKLNEAYTNGTRFVKLGETTEYTEWIVIDDKGKVWYSMDYDDFECMSDEYSEPLYGVNIIKFIGARGYFALSEDGHVWVGRNYDGTNMKMIEYSEFNNSRIIDIATDGNVYIAIDENGNVWTWGANDYYGLLGIGLQDYTTKEHPVCLQEHETQPLYGVKAIKVSTAEDHIIMLDNEGYLWGWGYNALRGELGNSTLDYVTEPINIPIVYNEKIDYNLTFKDIKVIGYEDAMIALDNHGRIWGWGSREGNGTGSGTTSSAKYIPQLINLDTKIVKIETSGYIGIAVDVNGQLYMWGFNGNGDFGNGTSNTDNMHSARKMDMSLVDNAKIVDVSAGDWNTVAAIDEDGNVWVWGGNGNSMLGTGNTNSNYYPTKLVLKNTAGVANNKKIVDIEIGYYCATAIDEDGKVWTWGSKGYTGLSELYLTSSVTSSYIEPICLTELAGNSLQVAYDNGVRFNKVCSGAYAALIDSDGKLWVSNYNKEFVCVSDIEEHPLYQSDNEYKIVELDADTSTSSKNIFAIDNNGDLWEVNQTTAIKLNGENQTLQGIKVTKYDYSGDAFGLIDNQGRIWTGGNNDSGKLGDGTDIPRDLVCLYKGNYNLLYNTKTTDIISDNFIETENGKIYNISTGISYYMEGSKYIEENNLGTVKQVKYLSVSQSYGSDNLFAIAIDEAGKVWTWGYTYTYSLFGDGQYSSTVKTIPQCISDITTNPLYLAKQANPNFKIVNIEINNSKEYITATDNSGKIWVWGKVPGTYIGATSTVSTPFCINGEGTALEGKTIDSIWFNGTYNAIILAEGKVYTAGNSTNFIGDSVAKTTLSPVSDENGELTGIQNVTVGNCVIAYNNTSVWAWGANSYGDVGTGNNVAQNIPVKILDNISVKDVYCSTYGCVVVDTNGKVWTWGYYNSNNAYSAPLGYVAETTYNAPVCISDDSTSPLYGKVITELIENSFFNTVMAKDSTGTIWGWGNDLQVLPTNLMETYNTELTSLFGTPNNENTEQFIKLLNTGYICYNNQVYTVERDRYGTITGYTHQQGELVDKTLVEICSNKALDDAGNLYAWGTETGIGTSVTEPICVTTIEKLTDPVFTDGWTKIQKQH